MKWIIIIIYLLFHWNPDDFFSKLLHQWGIDLCIYIFRAISYAEHLFYLKLFLSEAFPMSDINVTWNCFSQTHFLCAAHIWYGILNNYFCFPWDIFYALHTCFIWNPKYLFLFCLSRSHFLSLAFILHEILTLILEI